VSEIKRKKGESFEGFIRRVKDQWKRSGKILQARKIQYFEPKQSKNVKRTETVAKLKKGKQLDYLRKTGKLPAKQDPLRSRRKGR